MRNKKEIIAPHIVSSIGGGGGIVESVCVSVVEIKVGVGRAGKRRSFEVQLSRFGTRVDCDNFSRDFGCSVACGNANVSSVRPDIGKEIVSEIGKIDIHGEVCEIARDFGVVDGDFFAVLPRGIGYPPLRPARGQLHRRVIPRSRHLHTRQYSLMKIRIGRLRNNLGNPRKNKRSLRY